MPCEEIPPAACYIAPQRCDVAASPKELPLSPAATPPYRIVLRTTLPVAYLDEGGK